MAQGSSLKGRPREMMDKALGLKGNHPRALEMAGSAAYEVRDYDQALSYWEPLLGPTGPAITRAPRTEARCRTPPAPRRDRLAASKSPRRPAATHHPAEQLRRICRRVRFSRLSPSAVQLLGRTLEGNVLTQREFMTQLQIGGLLRFASFHT